EPACQSLHAAHPNHPGRLAIGVSYSRRIEPADGGQTMTYDDFLRRVPKVELHCHFEGAVRPGTFADLARQHRLALPSDDVDRLYDYASSYECLKIFGMVSSTRIDQEDFARAAYESIEDGVTLGNLRYREMFFNPTLHTKRGIPYARVVDGLVDGIRAAQTDLGVPCRLIADVYRQGTT